MPYCFGGLVEDAVLVSLIPTRVTIRRLELVTNADIVFRYMEIELRGTVSGVEGRNGGSRGVG